jgi:hypothetical protein
MAKAKAPTEVTATDSQGNQVTLTPTQELVQALVQAISLTKPTEKKNFNTRKPGDPWQPKDGSKKHKLLRKMHQHGIIIDPDTIVNEEIDLLNKIKPGLYLNGWVKVYKRKDQGIDIDYPVKTSSQRMKLNSFGIAEVRDDDGNLLKTGFQVLLEKILAEGNKVKPQPTTNDDE